MLLMFAYIHTYIHTYNHDLNVKNAVLAFPFSIQFEQLATLVSQQGLSNLPSELRPYLPEMDLSVAEHKENFMRYAMLLS